MYKVSVIVPVYNAEKYIRKCLKSLVEQTLKDIEIVLVNDGSNDGSLEIMEEFGSKYDNILILNKENGGQASARNFGVKECSGKYIGFIDADDYIEKDMYKEMYEIAVNNDCDMVECNYDYLDEQGNELAKEVEIRKFMNKKDMFINPYVVPWNKIFHKRVLKDNNLFFPEGYIYEDTSFFMKTIPYLNKYEFVDKSFVKYIKHSQSTMNNNKKYAKVGDIFKVLEDLKSYYLEKDFYDEYKEELEYFCVRILLCSSLRRIARIKDRQIRKKLKDKTLLVLQEQFLDYKNNKYMQNGLKSIYMKSVNKITINLYILLFSVI